MNRTIKTCLTFISALLASVATAQPQALDEERWTTVAEEGWWDLEDGQRLDLSTGWRVVRHLETGHERIVSQAYGTTSQTIETIPFWAFLPVSSSVSWTQSLGDGYGERVGSSPATFAYAPLQVPSGLRIEGIEMEACDDTAQAFLRVNLSKCEAFGSCTGIAEHSVSTGVAAAPGCAFFNAFPEEPHTINNFSNVYRLILHDTSSGDGVLRLRSVRVYLRRQVSPAPQTATFGDVPTDHLFFQHIEALAASGITGGCDADNFCPNNPLTRGQMAAFLANALGLHWPN